jgi:poly-gamma-glutamate synthase PgsB/CapB
MTMRSGNSMNRKQAGTARRVLVTGSRGKSSIVRLLHAACTDAGLRSYARITGVVPRELGPDGVRAINRSSGAHVGEMRWWLRGIPADAEAIILENSAITPEFQELAGRWLRPEITVLTNTVPDHQEAWGPTGACAKEVLVKGIPAGGQVIVPASLKSDRHLLALLDSRQCRITFAESVSEVEEPHRAVNLGLALATADRLGIPEDGALESMLRLQPGAHEFRVVDHGGAALAMAFSANDIASTRSLFHSLSWPEEETRLIYNHRADRPARFRSFVSWLGRPWRQVLIIGDRPRWRAGIGCYTRIKTVEELLGLARPGDRIFGCGNMAGVPLSLTAVADR